MRSANHFAAASAAGRKVGFGRSGSCSVCSRMPRPSSRRFGRRLIAVSVACMTSRMIVRRDHPNGASSRRVWSGWRSIAPIHFSGLVRRVPSPVIGVNRRLIKSPPCP